MNIDPEVAPGTPIGTLKVIKEHIFNRLFYLGLIQSNFSTAKIIGNSNNYFNLKQAWLGILKKIRKTPKFPLMDKI